MVAIIKTGRSISRTLNYNEQKVKQGKAQCIAAFNYPKDVDQLSFNDKLNRLTKQAELNQRATRNSVHISLNFDPSEVLSKEKLQAIAETYMNKIGFGDQPYLVYQHIDAGHPHIHIATIKIKSDGSRIDTQNIGRNESQKARLEIEQDFGLVKANGRQRQAYKVKPVNAEKVQYGKTETKRAITNVLDAVLHSYKYASIPELNAILQQYNVVADRGNKDSRIYQKNGLVYRILDEKGEKVGVPIKASAIYSKPTMKWLEEKFKENEKARVPLKARIKNAIELELLARANLTLPGLIRALRKFGIDTVLRQNETGFIYGITFIDHVNKAVFNGSALGKEYSVASLQARCSENSIASDTRHQLSEGHLLRSLLESGPTAEANPLLPEELMKRKKKRKRLSH